MENWRVMGGGLYSLLLTSPTVANQMLVAFCIRWLRFLPGKTEDRNTVILVVVWTWLKVKCKLTLVTGVYWIVIGSLVDFLV